MLVELKLTQEELKIVINSLENRQKYIEKISHLGSFNEYTGIVDLEYLIMKLKKL